jgi:hypothetical protein
MDCPSRTAESSSARVAATPERPNRAQFRSEGEYLACNGVAKDSTGGTMETIGKPGTSRTELSRPGSDPAKFGGVMQCRIWAVTSLGVARSGAGELESDARPGWVDVAFKGSRVLRPVCHSGY